MSNLFLLKDCGIAGSHRVHLTTLPANSWPPEATVFPMHSTLTPCCRDEGACHVLPMTWDLGVGSTGLTSEDSGTRID